MDSARAFRKYLSARIRAERMELLPTTQRHPPLQRYNPSYSRLPAGGRLSESFHLNLNRLVGRKSSQKIPRKSDVLEPQPQLQTKSKKVKSKCRLKFKNPVLVVRSRPRLECSSSSEGASIKVRFSKSPLRPGNLREQPPLSCVTDQKQSCSIIEAKSSPCPIIETKSSPCPIIESKSSPSPIIEPKSSSVTKERHISFTEVEQPPCDTHITQQLTTLMQKLEDQLANERKQKEELNAINSQLKQLTGTVTNLNDKCKQFETEKSKLKLEQPCLGNQGCEEKLCHKPSSICQFCAHQQLPVLCSMQNELFQLMGKRLFSDVALTILLRADNVYHVNVRDLDTGKVLGCLLVNETGIKQANSLGIFQEILTFCVIDVRSSMSTRDAIFGGINFEFVRDQRLHGGHSGQRKQLFREMHCPINSLKADQAVARAPHRCSSFQHQREKKSKSKLSISQALLQIGTIDKSLVLSDDEANYPVSGIEIVSMMESSPPCSETDRYST